MRQVVLDTETTGISPSQGHRVIEVGCVELINRRLTGKTLHYYCHVDKEVDPGAFRVHGISNEFLADKPTFAEIVDELKEFLAGAELIIHNAKFDLGFLNNELALLKDPWGTIEQHCSVLDTLALARDKHPGQKNNLDALCKRYNITNTHRELHGALLDSEILADVYLAMTGGQGKLAFNQEESAEHGDTLLNTEGEASAFASQQAKDLGRPPLLVIKATPEELKLHNAYLAKIKSD